MEVTVIKAKAKEKKILKVAAYCRVSVEQDDQEGSIANQKEHYEELIRKNPDYILAGSIITLVWHLLLIPWEETMTAIHRLTWNLSACK